MADRVLGYRVGCQHVRVGQVGVRGMVLIGRINPRHPRFFREIHLFLGKNAPSLGPAWGFRGFRIGTCGWRSGTGPIGRFELYTDLKGFGTGSFFGRLQTRSSRGSNGTTRHFTENGGPFFG